MSFRCCPKPNIKRLFATDSPVVVGHMTYFLRKEYEKWKEPVEVNKMAKFEAPDVKGGVL